jgi:hypothetical protein
VNTIIFSLHEK